MQSEIGWAPPRPNYSKYERGSSTPNRTTFAKFVSFWSRYGIEPPDLTPQPEPVPLDMSALIAANTAALEAQTAAFLTLAASIDRAADGVVHRVSTWDSHLEGLLLAVRGLPATADSEPGAPPSVPQSGRTRAG